MESKLSHETMICRLQKTAILSYKEARAFLCEEYGETPDMLAKEFGVTINAIYNLQRRARNKVNGCMFSYVEIQRQDCGWVFGGEEE